MRRFPTLGTMSCLVGAVVLLAACGDRTGKTLQDPIFPPPETTVPATSDPVESAPPVPLALIAPWVDGSLIPDRNTCNGEGIAPALSWPNIPLGTVELAVTAVDLDAGNTVSWILYAISPTSAALAEDNVPAGAFLWPNSAGEAAWSAPCAPDGETHRYEFTVYALNQQLEVADDAGAPEVISILNTTAIARSSISGLVSGGP